MNRNFRNTCYIALLGVIILTAACSNIKKELAGNARPDVGIAEQIPPTKIFNASFESTWNAAKEVLDGHDILYEADKANGKIVTEEKALQNITGWQAMFAGSNYKAKQFIDVKQNSESQTTVKLSARFTKELATVFVTTNKEYPEAENMLRKSFFEEIEKLLTAVPAPAPAPSPAQLPNQTAPAKGKKGKK
jgi:hypothetical protein